MRAIQNEPIQYNELNCTELHDRESLWQTNSLEWIKISSTTYESEIAVYYKLIH